MTKTFDAVDSKHLSYLMRIKALKANWNDTKNSWTGWLKQNKTNWWKQKSKSGWADLHHDNWSRDDNTDYFALCCCRHVTRTSLNDSA